MRWTKLRILVEERFAPSVAKRLAIHSAAYGNCTCGHCWITLDRNVIANFCTRAYYNKKSHGDDGSNPMYKDQLVLYGEKSRQDAYSSMFDYVHNLSHNEALKSDDVLIQALAVLDSRLGKRRLAAFDDSELHPLAKKLLAIRREAELAQSNAA
jgi:hypothetical protein